MQEENVTTRVALLHFGQNDFTHTKVEHDRNFEQITLQKQYRLPPHDGGVRLSFPRQSLSDSLYLPSIYAFLVAGGEKHQLHQGPGLHDVGGGLRLRPQNHRGDRRLPRRRQLCHGERLDAFNRSSVGNFEGSPPDNVFRVGVLQKMVA